MNSDPLEAARKRGFIRPTEPQPPEPEPHTSFWLAVILAFIAFAVMTPLFDLPFAGK